MSVNGFFRLFKLKVFEVTALIQTKFLCGHLHPYFGHQPLALKPRYFLYHLYCCCCCLRHDFRIANVSLDRFPRCLQVRKCRIRYGKGSWTSRRTRTTLSCLWSETSPRCQVRVYRRCRRHHHCCHYHGYFSLLSSSSSVSSPSLSFWFVWLVTARNEVAAR